VNYHEIVPAFFFDVELMEEILHQLIGSLSQAGWYIPGGAGFLPSRAVTWNPLPKLPSLGIGLRH